MSYALSAAIERKEIHARRLAIGVYERADGLFDIEGQIVDVRPEPYDLLDRPRAGGEPMHDLWLRLTVDDAWTVRHAEAAMPAGAYRHCHLVTPNFANLEGLTIGRGWNKGVRERVGGTAGCTHLVSLLAQMASAAYQALWDIKLARMQESDEDPGVQTIDTCYAYRSDGPLVAERYPDHFVGERDDHAAE